MARKSQIKILENRIARIKDTLRDARERSEAPALIKALEEDLATWEEELVRVKIKA